MSSDYYRILGIAPTASSDEIKRLYKKLAVKYHPDKTDDPNLHKKFILINEAYETLKDSALRANYDSKNGIQTPGYASKPQDPGFKSHHGYTYYLSTSSSSRAGGASYFSWHQLNARAYADAYDRHMRQEQEDAATVAAKLAQKKMKEDLERRRKEYLQEAQRAREREMRERLERDLWEQRANARRNAEQQMQEEYIRAKQRAQQNRWHLSHGFGHDYDEDEYDEMLPPPASGPGHDSTRPIIVEDEEELVDDEDSLVDEDDEEEVGEEESENFEDCQSAPPSAQAHDPNESIKQEDDSLDDNISDGSLGAPQTPKDGPEVVEVPEESDGENGHNIFTGSHNTPLKGPADMSPPREPQTLAYFKQPQPREEKPSRPQAPNSAKKPRFADMSDMRESLGTNLEDVNFEDLRENLPQTPKTRKASGSIQSSSKRPRVHEYTDGTARAQTLFTPINKLSTRPSNNTISPSDLAPEFDENSLMFTVQPPQIEIGLSLTYSQWDTYVQSIHEYERKFAEYRKAVLQYQMGRLEKDERHHNIIYSDVSCLDAYQTCLFNDMLLLQNYHRALLEFRDTLKTFKLNCSVINAMQILGNV